jgi:RNA ligase
MDINLLFRYILTMSCRGLVTDGCGNIVARAFSKFFNFNEKNAYRLNPGEEYDVLEKGDGSMILLFKYQGQWLTCTRGSFKSEQCIKAASMLSAQQLSELDGNNTYVFEIIYPENRVVVNYGKREELVYLATFRNIDGVESNDSDFIKKIGINTVPTKDTRIFHSLTFSET